MNIDFAAVMVSALVICGGIWAVDHWLWAPKRRSRPDDTYNDAHQAARREPVIVEYARSFFPVILIVLLLRSFLVEPFRIPSASMMPTLLAGDFILVNKFTYGLRLPVLDTKFLAVGAPQRGDTVVFRYPRDPSIDYIKRVVGLPGDRIRYVNKTLYINDDEAPHQLVGTYTGMGAGRPYTGTKLLVEQLGDVSHQILLANGRQSAEGEFIVPEGHYFVMGDNRDNSNDSRYWGVVPEENLVGKAFMIWMNWDYDAGGVTWGRIGSHIK